MKTAIQLIGTIIFLVLIFDSGSLTAQHTINPEKGCVNGDCVNGYGIYIYDDGSKYQGEFKNGLAEGQGACYYANGDWYAGEWKAHNFNGEGKYVAKNGQSYHGTWEKGILIKEIQSAAPTKEIRPPTKVWAIVIGVASYTGIASLRYTDDDAYKVYSFLKSPEGGAVPDEQIVLLIDEAATKNSIIKNLQEISDKAGESDAILIYMSGHGERGMFLPHDFNLADKSNNLSYHELIGYVQGSKAKSKIILADVCYAGSMTDGLLATKSASNNQVNSTINAYYEAHDNSNGGLVLILSSSSEEQSIENKGIRHGVFSYFLIDGLKGNADYNTDNIITVEEIHTYTRSNVQYYTNFHQNPVITGSYDNDIPLAVVRN